MGGAERGRIMHSAASQPAEDPAPERAELDARAQAVLDGQMELVSRATALLGGCPDAVLLRQLITETIAAGLHCEELRTDMARYVATASAVDAAWADGWSAREAAMKEDARPKVTRQGHRAPGKWTQNPILRSIKVVAFGALVWSGLRYAFRAHRIAAALTAVTLPVAVGAGTYVALQPGTASSLPAASAPNPAASVEAAAPLPSSSLAGSVRHARKAAKGGGRRLLNGSGVPVSWISMNSPQQSSSSSSSSSSSAPSVQASVSVGPAQLSLGGITSLDLSNPLDPQVTFTITASGGGWASWRISTAGTDLDFSPSSGVLQAGGSVTVTVSLAPSLDNLTQQTFTVAGQQVTVALPLPVPVVLPSPVVSASVIPSLP